MQPVRQHFESSATVHSRRPSPVHVASASAHVCDDG